MPNYFFNEQTSSDYIEKLNKITPEMKPLWGKLDPTQLMRHLRFTFDLSMGKEEGKDLSNIFTRSILRLMFFHWFPNWPKGKIQAPEYFTPVAEGDFETERSALIESANQFLAALKQNPNEKHLSPLLGEIPLSYWTRVHGVHIRHHLRQYGVWE